MARRPEPTALRVLRGNPSRRPLPEGEPQPLAGLPSPPAHLNGLALAEWERVGTELVRLGVVTQIDSAALAAYCAAYARWAMAEAAIQRPEDLLAIGAMGCVIVNPLIRVANQALDQMKGYMIELGLTPSSRTRIKAVKPQEVDALDTFLTSGKKRRG